MRSPLNHVLLLLLALLNGGSTTQPAPPDESMNAVAFITGHWAQEKGGERVEEHWTTPAAGAMFGNARTIREGKTVFFEFLRIEARAGAIFYVASPRGQGATPFRLTDSGPNKAVFENPKHDFPTKITYWREGDALCAKIEGVRGGQPASEQWTFLPIAASPAGASASGAAAKP